MGWIIGGGAEVVACVIGSTGAELPLSRFTDMSDTDNDLDFEGDSVGVSASGSGSSTTCVVSVVFCVIGTADPVNSKANSSDIARLISFYDVV